MGRSAEQTDNIYLACFICRADSCKLASACCSDNRRKHALKALRKVLDVLTPAAVRRQNQPFHLHLLKMMQIAAADWQVFAAAFEVGGGGFVVAANDVADAVEIDDH